MSKVLLEVQDVKKHFPVTRGLLIARVEGWIKAVDGISFSIKEGETFGLVGESGCGKTTTSRLILLLEKLTGGSIIFDGQDIQYLSTMDLKRYRSSVQAVFQDPFSSLSPRMRVGRIIAEPILANYNPPNNEIRERVRKLLLQVGLSPSSADLYPHEFSGGQRQRIAVARALSVRPRLVILDEPVSALDLSVRAQLMNLLKDLQKDLGVAYLLIAHDLAVTYHMSNMIGVMYLGKIVEIAPSEELYSKPLHPYTRGLLAAALPLHPDEHGGEAILSGEVPSPINILPGCRFHPRCSFAMPICSEVEPPLKLMSGEHSVACHLYVEGGEV